MKTVAVSGYFDPIHIGHIEYLRLAKEFMDKLPGYGGHLVVILNNDKQLKLKRGKEPFMPQEERREILKAIKYVNFVVLSIDEDKSICKTLKQLKPEYFCKGGDRTKEEIPEAKVCKELGIEIVDGLGKKIQSSSALLRKKDEM